jgi:hypothetical protein
VDASSNSLIVEVNLVLDQSGDVGSESDLAMHKKSVAIDK